jgi:hypothetical protein
MWRFDDNVQSVLEYVFVVVKVVEIIPRFRYAVCFSVEFRGHYLATTRLRQEREPPGFVPLTHIGPVGVRTLALACSVRRRGMAGDDQLVLGIKGTLSVVELKVIRQRMLAGQEAKARRGELFKRLPIGYACDPVGKIMLHPDRRVCDSPRSSYTSNACQ